MTFKTPPSVPLLWVTKLSIFIRLLLTSYTFVFNLQQNSRNSGDSGNSLCSILNSKQNNLLTLPEIFALSITIRNYAHV